MDTCVKCGAKLPIGDFAYNQEVCWLCFKEDVLSIRDKLTSDYERDIMEHLLAVMAEIHHKNIKEDYYGISRWYSLGK